VGDIPLTTQVKLLRFLEERVVERVGGRQSIRIDTRVLSATNQDLARLIAEGRFREDLFYRINEIAITCRLCATAEATACCSRVFLRKYAKEFGRTLRASPTMLRAPFPASLARHVRELEGRVKRAAIMAEGALVTAGDLDLAQPEAERSLNLREARKRAERKTIELALSEVEGNISKAAGAWV